MGAGISRARKTSIIRRELHKIQRELAEAGIKTKYRRGTPSTYASIYAHAGDGAPILWVSFRFIHASNGECAGWPVAQLTEGSSGRTITVIDYDSAPWMGGNNYRVALDIIKNRLRPAVSA